MAASEGCMRGEEPVRSPLAGPESHPVTHPGPWSLAVGPEVWNRARCLLRVIFGLKPLSLFWRPSHKDHIRVAETESSRLAGGSGGLLVAELWRGDCG